MTKEEIDKIASDYLNDCESESDMLEVFVVAKEALNQEPQTGHWIPVSKKLPEESGAYLTTVRVKSTNETFMDISNLDADGIIKRWNWVEEYEVLAWMPLPQIYKAESYESMLDKIRAEIEKECKPCIYEVDFAYKKGLSRALEIIDKYRKGKE